MKRLFSYCVLCTAVLMIGACAKKYDRTEIVELDFKDDAVDCGGVRGAGNIAVLVVFNKRGEPVVVPCQFNNGDGAKPEPELRKGLSRSKRGAIEWEKYTPPRVPENDDPCYLISSGGKRRYFCWP